MGDLWEEPWQCWDGVPTPLWAVTEVPQALLLQSSAFLMFPPAEMWLDNPHPGQVTSPGR